MATIQEKYNKYIQGSISRDALIYEIRRDEALKSHVSNVMSFDDSIRVLKQRGIITEAAKKVESLTLDTANPYEYRKGLDYETDTCYSHSPELTDDEFAIVQKKVLKNLAKNANYYTNLYAGLKATHDDKTQDDVVVKPGDKAVDKINASKNVGKKVKSNVTDTLNQKEKAKSKTAGVKVMTASPKKVKGVKVMAMPGKEKIIKIKEGFSLRENIPASTSNMVPFADITASMKAVDDSGEQFKIIAKGNYNEVKRYDSSRQFDKFLSSDPTGVDANQLVALIDKDGNTFVRVYGTGGVYVYDKPQELEAITKSAIVVKPNSPEADPMRLKRYTDKGLDIKLDPNMKENMNLSKILKELDLGEPEIANKIVPQDEKEMAAAKAAIMPTIMKAMLEKSMNLNKDIVVKDGQIWVRVNLGVGVLDKEKLKILCADGKFAGVNPVDNSTITLVFNK